MLIPKLGKPNLERFRFASSKFHAEVEMELPKFLIVTII